MARHLNRIHVLSDPKTGLPDGPHFAISGAPKTMKRDLGSVISWMAAVDNLPFTTIATSLASRTCVESYVDVAVPR